MIVWASGWIFSLFLPFSLLLVGLWMQRKNYLASLQFSSIKGVKAAGVNLRARLAKMPFLIKVLALSLVIVALARPQRADTKVSRTSEGIDIILALDVSASMLIEDMIPENRLEAS